MITPMRGATFSSCSDINAQAGRLTLPLDKPLATTPFSLYIGILTPF